MTTRCCNERLIQQTVGASSDNFAGSGHARANLLLCWLPTPTFVGVDSLCGRGDIVDAVPGIIRKVVATMGIVGALVPATACDFTHHGCLELCETTDDCVSDHVCMAVGAVLRCMPEECQHCDAVGTCLYDPPHKPRAGFETQKQCHNARCTIRYQPGSPMPAE